MDLEEARRVLYTRVQCLDPSNVLKIMGYLLIQDIGKQEMLQLAMSSDSALQAFVARAKVDLGLLAKVSSSSAANEAVHHPNGSCIYAAANSSSSGMTTTGFSNEEQQQQQQLLQLEQQQQQELSGPFLSHSTSLHEKHAGGGSGGGGKSGYEALEMQQQQQQNFSTGKSAGNSSSPPMYLNQLYDLLAMQQQQNQERINSKNHSGGEFSGEFSGTGFHLPFLSRSSSNGSLTYDVNVPPVHSSSVMSTAWKPCLYFSRGYCKHGSGCRFLHVPGRTPSYSSLSDDSQDSQGDSSFHSESLEHLEVELRELLSGRRSPVSIASLPQLYYEKFGKTLQADGYLTESQRHGKAGYSLTKLLARLKSTVALIDRPHGQHAVVLAEDSHKFMAYRGDGEDLGFTVNPSSRQIYLTFPAESSFSEEDVTTHFNAYGPVQDVRIPYQQKRMFGFVTFTYSETVRTILAEGNPHYICGARVLVKPYKEKGKHGDKKSADRMEQQAKQIHYRTLERNRQSALRYYLQDQALARSTISDDELTAALQQKLAELHFANVQKRICDTTPNVNMPSYLDHLHNQATAVAKVPDPDDPIASAQDLHQQPNPYGFVLDILDGDPVEEPKAQSSSQENQSKEHHALPCNLQSDHKALANPSVASLPPTFFAHDIF